MATLRESELLDHRSPDLMHVATRTHTWALHARVHASQNLHEISGCVRFVAACVVAAREAIAKPCMALLDVVAMGGCGNMTLTVV